MQFIETFADIYWSAQKKRLRGFRTMPEGTRDAAARTAQSMGDMVDIAIMVYGWDPLSVMTDRLVTGGQPGLVTSVDPKDFPRAADLHVDFLSGWGKLGINPQYPNRHGVNYIGDAWYPATGDTTDIGSQAMANGATFQKVLGVAQPGPDPTYYADYSLQGLIQFWLRIS